MITEAQRELAKRQLSFPPWNREDRAVAIFNSYRTGLPSELNSMINSGALVLGEVGIAEPDSHTKRIGDAEFTVELYSGLMEFYYTITRMLCGAQRQFASGGIEQPSLSMDETIRRVADVFKDWQAGRFWNGRRYRHHLFLIHQGQREIAEYLATRAEAFVLAHELGHVMIDSGHWPDEATATAFRNEETHADVFAVNLILRSAPSGKYRMRYAGIVLSMRIFALLARLGFDFSSGSHPVPAERLNVLRNVARELLPNELSYAWLSTIAAAYDEQMEAVENVILGHGSKTIQTVERIAIRLFAMIEEAVNGHVENIVTAVAPQLQDISDDVLIQAAAKLNGWLNVALENDALDPTGGLRPKMSELLRLLARDLPAQYKSAFKNAGVTPA